ncbi:MAG: bifunctional riboflavin kinase/FAD synthetase [Pseudomonadota bacterium]
MPESVGLVSTGSVVTIGAFDGLHVGHETIVNRVCTLAAQRKSRAVVMTFEPAPKAFFAGTKGDDRLMCFRQRFERLQQLGVDMFFCPRFDAELANQSADDFVRHWLLEVLHCRHIVVGDDFRYGRERTGTFASLRSAGQSFGFEVERTDSVVVGGERVSSTAIREALRLGQIYRVSEFLGRPYAVVDRVRHGQKLGRTLGFPTANLSLHRRLVPRHGVYAVRVSGAGLTNHAGVASLGTRPTVADNGAVLLEVHVLDVSRDMYGQRLRVEFIDYLRPEARFESLDAMVVQMHNDCDRARHALAMAGNGEQGNGRNARRDGSGGQ